MIKKKKTILLVEDEPKLCRNIAEILGKKHKLEVAEKLEEAIKYVKSAAPDLILIDFDLRETDGLQVFRKIHPLVPQVKAIMFSASKSIPLAVSAAKLGINDFLPKPLSPDALRQSVEDNLFRPEKVYLSLSGLDAPYLEGKSPKLEEMFAEIEKAIEEDRNVILVSPPGIDKSKVAQVIHGNGFKKERKLVVLDLSSFGEGTTEVAFWTALQEIMAEPQLLSFQSPQERCGTLYLENIESLSEHFRWSILDFLGARRGKLNREIKVVIGVTSKETLKGFNPENFQVVEIPSLAQRKEDLPHLIKSYLEHFARKFNKPVKYLSAEVLEFLAAYDFPGNYQELENLLCISVLLTGEKGVGLPELPLSLNMFLESNMNQIAGSRKLSFKEAKLTFEKNFYQVLLAKARNLREAANFLDLPPSVFEERLKTLGILPSL